MLQCMSKLLEQTQSEEEYMVEIMTERYLQLEVESGSLKML